MDDTKIHNYRRNTRQNLIVGRIMAMQTQRGSIHAPGDASLDNGLEEGDASGKPSIEGA